jgi:hypothetical protein
MIHDASIDLLFEIEVAKLKSIAISLRDKRRERRQKTFGWCFYHTAGDLDEEVDFSRKRDAESHTARKRVRRTSPSPPPAMASPAHSPASETYNTLSYSFNPDSEPEEEVSAEVPIVPAVRARDEHTVSDARKERSNALRRFNLATSTPSLKSFIRAAKAAGADVDKDDFDEKVIEQQLIKLKEANKAYVRKKLSSLKKQVSKKMVEDAADLEYKTTYEDNFDKEFKSILIKNHIRYAIEDIQKQVCLKIKNRRPHYEKKKMDSLKQALMNQIDARAAIWRNGSSTSVLKEFYKERQSLFKKIAKECPEYQKDENVAGDMSS